MRESATTMLVPLASTPRLGAGVNTRTRSSTVPVLPAAALMPSAALVGSRSSTVTFSARPRSPSRSSPGRANVGGTSTRRLRRVTSFWLVRSCAFPDELVDRTIVWVAGSKAPSPEPAPWMVRPASAALVRSTVWV